MEATGEVASQIEVKLSVLIEDLRTSDGESFDIQSLNKEIRNLMEQLRAKIKVIFTVFLGLKFRNHCLLFD